MAQFRKDRHEYLPDGKTIFEVMMLADQYGNLVGPANPSGMAVDAFGRAKVSQPVTLFDSFLRYQDNGKFYTSNTATATYTHSSNASTMSLTVDTTSGAKVQRETARVFSYQPGKGLHILNTFVMNTAKPSLDQRVGYYNDLNGIYIEQTGTTVRFAIRSTVNGTTTHEYVNQADWNVDTMLGAVDSSPSGYTLDLTKAQIMFIDIEWLGVGSVRCGFVINGQLIHCHSFHHANINSAVYMTTACLPIRYEIENTGITSGSSTLKQICSSVISDGGYEIRGRPRSWGLEPIAASQRALAVAGTYYPVASIQLKSDRLDAIVIPRIVNLSGVNSAVYRWRLVSNSTITGASWQSAGSDSSVNYNSNTLATSSGGTILDSGYLNTTNQAAGSVTLDSTLFKYQLERNGLTSTPVSFSLEVTSGSATCNVVAGIDWEEIT